MKYRMLDANGDYVFGKGPSEFLVNTPATVGQGVETRLNLFTNEWFIDLLKGLPVLDEILGTGTQSIYDQVIQEYILDSEGVTQIIDYSSTLDASRHLAVTAKIDTVYGVTTVQASL